MNFQDFKFVRDKKCDPKIPIDLIGKTEDFIPLGSSTMVGVMDGKSSIRFVLRDDKDICLRYIASDKDELFVVDGGVVSRFFIDPPIKEVDDLKIKMGINDGSNPTAVDFDLNM
ncbi:hypothetical protein AALP_AA6G135000 [Arabis alpina]|uniref:Uncharacterized protein n=1 Tax=Arabis alpina TaxID=50452 RepID=A0A087GP05_ARAAL|nr:hypothetical protein AALP_AA6G135000 [Arabis alpina]